MNKIIYDKVIFVAATDSRTNKITVYVKYSTDSKMYAVKIMSKASKITELETHSLSNAMYRAARLIAHYTDGLTTRWEALSVN